MIDLSKGIRDGLVVRLWWLDDRMYDRFIRKDDVVGVQRLQGTLCRTDGPIAGSKCSHESVECNSTFRVSEDAGRCCWGRGHGIHGHRRNQVMGEEHTNEKVVVQARFVIINYLVVASRLARHMVTVDRNSSSAGD